MATIGLIAGGGRFPLLFAESARAAGHRVIAVAHSSEADPALEKWVDQITWFEFGTRSINCFMRSPHKAGML